MRVHESICWRISMFSLFRHGLCLIPNVLKFRLLSLMCQFIVLLCTAYDKEQTEKEKNRFLHNVVVWRWFAANLIFYLNATIRGSFFNKVPRPLWCDKVTNFRHRVESETKKRALPKGGTRGKGLSHVVARSIFSLRWRSSVLVRWQRDL